MSTDWEAHYQANDTPWDKGEPSPGLVDWLAAHPAVPRGTVLVPGCGMGHDVRAWAAAGWLMRQTFRCVAATVNPNVWR